MPARRAVVIGRERSPDLRTHAEDVEVVAGNQLAADALGLSLRGHRERRAEARDDAVEHRVLIAKIAIHRIGQRAAVEGPPLKSAGAVEQDEPLGRFDRQQAQQHLIGQREDRRVRADAEREGQHDHDGEGWCLRERAERIAQILSEGHDPSVADRAFVVNETLRSQCKGSDPIQFLTI